MHVKEDAEAPAGPASIAGEPARAGGPMPISLAPGPVATTIGRGTSGPSSVGAAVSDPSRQMFAFRPDEDAPPCPDCGSIMVRNAACYKCLNCGATSGCS